MGTEGSRDKDDLGWLEENVHVKGIRRHGFPQFPCFQSSNVVKIGVTYSE